MAKPLDERIAAAMSPDARIATVAELITEVAAAIGDAKAEHDRLDGISKSVTASEAEADAAADATATLNRKIIRLTAKQEQLEQRHKELTESERQTKQRAEYEEIKGRRDTLAAELAERWPVLTGELAALLSRLEASDAECAHLNGKVSGGYERLTSAEATARECPGNFYDDAGPISRLYSTVLPSLRGKGQDKLTWPPHRPFGSRTPVPTP